MKQVASPAANKVRIHATSNVYRNTTYDHRPLELTRLGEYDCRDIGEELEQILERSFHGGELTTMVGLDLLIYMSAMQCAATILRYNRLTSCTIVCAHKS